ncbi:hypothetical protein BH11PAT3_BH11PAT3_1170 [soil metagenome]
MFTLFIFYISGACIALFLLAKVLESKRRKSFFFLRLISKGDERFRDLSLQVTHAYSEYKEKGEFFFRKQLPLHTKNLVNKIEALVKEKSEKYLGDIRNSKLLQPKNEGISDFFKNMKVLEEENTTESEGVLDREDKKL